ncbi:MAG: DUF484 family protein [Magnetococcus sp. DMHC-6]
MENQLDFTEEQVRNWLLVHPDFFSRHADLLPSAITASGRILSLEAGQLDRLRGQNEQLQLQLEQMLERIRRNEEIYHTFHSLQIRMITAPNPLELIRTISEEIENNFDIHRVTVTFSDRSDGFIKLFQNLGPQNNCDNRLFTIPHATLLETFGTDGNTVIRVGHENKNRTQFFGLEHPVIRSEALIPLLVNSQSGGEQSHLMGSLNLGGRTPSRFLPSDSTDLLYDLATVLATILAHYLKKNESC